MINDLIGKVMTGAVGSLLQDGVGRVATAHLVPAVGVPTTKVTDETRREFIEKGYVVIPSAVDASLRKAALRLINCMLGRGTLDAVQAQQFQNGVQLPEIMARPAILDLINNSEAINCVRAICGDVGIVHAGQIALRFPGALCVDNASFTPIPLWDQMWHVDGLTSHVMPHVGDIYNFSVLVGVFLEDVDDDLCGNLTVYPGAHVTMNEFCKKPGMLDRVKKDGNLALPRFGSAEFPMPAPPVQIKAKAGDVVLAHYMLPHTIAPNTSEKIRYAVYFRIYAANHPQMTYKEEAMLDMWMDFPRLHPLLPPRRPPSATSSQPANTATATPTAVATANTAATTNTAATNNNNNNNNNLINGLLFMSNVLAKANSSSSSSAAASTSSSTTSKTSQGKPRSEDVD